MPLVEDLDIYGENFFYGDAQAFEYIYKESYNWVAGEVSKVLPAGSPEAEGCINTIYNVLNVKKLKIIILSKEVLLHGLLY